MVLAPVGISVCKIFLLDKLLIVAFSYRKKKGLEFYDTCKDKVPRGLKKCPQKEVKTYSLDIENN